MIFYQVAVEFALITVCGGLMFYSDYLLQSVFSISTFNSVRSRANHKRLTLPSKTVQFETLASYKIGAVKSGIEEINLTVTDVAATFHFFEKRIGQVRKLLFIALASWGAISGLKVVGIFLSLGDGNVESVSVVNDKGIIETILEGRHLAALTLCSIFAIVLVMKFEHYQFHKRVVDLYEPER